MLFMFCFKLQQSSLCIQSSGKTCQGMIAADNTMAGNENADTISSDSTSNGSCAIGVTHTYDLVTLTTEKLHHMFGSLLLKFIAIEYCTFPAKVTKISRLRKKRCNIMFFL